MVIVAVAVIGSVAIKACLAPNHNDSQEYKRGATACRGRKVAENAKFFRHAFEICRRFKITNPVSMFVSMEFFSAKHGPMA